MENDKVLDEVRHYGEQLAERIKGLDAESVKTPYGNGQRDVLYGVLHALHNIHAIPRETLEKVQLRHHGGYLSERD